MSKILLVGPNRERASGIRSLMKEDGHEVAWARIVEGWVDAEREILPDLVIAAVSECDRMLEAGGRKPRGFPAPLLFVQNEADLFQEQFEPDRLIDQITSPFMREELLARADALIRVRKVIRRSGVEQLSEVEEDDGSEQTGTFKRLGRQLTAVLGSRVPRYSKPLGPYAEVAARVADWADRRDGMEPGHAERVTMFCNMIAEGLRLPRDQANSLLRAAMLHDIGKVGIPMELLKKEGPLEEDQMRLMRTHPQKGAALMRALDRDEEVVRTILYHHERPDGTGYYGKSGKGVPVTSRVLAVAETYDAMTRSQVRAQISPEDALEYLKQGRGHMFDADCVDALSDVLQPRRTCIPLSSVGY